MTPELSRRAVLQSVAAVCAAVVLPPALSATPAPVAVSKPLGVAWSVGSPDEWDWQHIVARTEEEAKRFWCEEVHGVTECEGSPDGATGDECDCEFCYNFRGLEAGRVPQWDGKVKISAADWIRTGMGCYCSRCHEEAYADACDNPAFIVGEDVLHEECMTLADWDIKDPERAAEIRADMAEA